MRPGLNLSPLTVWCMLVVAATVLRSTPPVPVVPGRLDDFGL
jgi:hypothetical protein